VRVLVKGLAASAGQAQGVARVIATPGDCEKVQPGEILVAVITDPSMIGAIQKAKAIVTDLGGLGSHPAIVARELGIPCVVGTGNATSVLKDGMEVLVDGSKGVVYDAS